MSNPDAWKAIMWSVLTSTTLAGSAVWLLRKWISAHVEASIRHTYEIARIKFETDLKRESEASLERLRSELWIEAARRSAGLTRVHEKRMEIVSRMAELLWALRKAVQEYTAPIELKGTAPKPERRRVVAKALQALDEFYAPNRCFVPKATCGKIDSFREKLRDVTLEFMDVVESGDNATGDPSGPLQTWKRTRDVIVDETPRLLDDLNDDFQGMLGIVSDRIPAVTEQGNAERPTVGTQRPNFTLTPATGETAAGKT